MPRLRSMPPRIPLATRPLNVMPEAERYGMGRGGRPWRRKVERVKARDEGICQPHKREGLIHIGHECDHIVPLSQGGSDDEGNLEWVCTTYHRAKTAREGRSR